MPLETAAVYLALHEISAHPCVVDVQVPVFDKDRAYVTFGLKLDFGSRWEAEGASPTGVRPVEEVRLDFGPHFPSDAPKPSLRTDFSRDHPHIQPWLGPEGRVVPCLVDGSLNEFVAARGVYRMIDQFVKWLRSAAAGRLIDPKQGWEPMRRDDCNDVLIASAEALRSVVDLKGGFRFFRTTYMWKRGGSANLYYGELGEETSAKLATFESQPDEDGWGVGLGVALVVWAGRAPEGGPAICDRYVPDDVATLAGLKTRAAELRMLDGLSAGLNLLRRHPAFEAAAASFPLPVVFMVRRPTHLIGSDSDLELCSYVVPFARTGVEDADLLVTPLAHAHAISPDLLRRLSGEPVAESWALVGCGSLGSKIGLHRARAGAAPVACADSSSLRAHNTARHALYPRKRMVQLGWGGRKAVELANAIEGLGQSTLAVDGNHRQLLAAFGTQIPSPQWLLNTTASTVVREDLARRPDAPRVVEGCLFDSAKLGYLATEGRARNPDTAELFGEFYELARREPDIGAKLYGSARQIEPVSIGQGCASLTMITGDAQISAMASLMSDVFGGLADPELGRIDILLREGAGVAHHGTEVSAYRRMPLEGLDGWTLSLSENAYEAITREAAAHVKTETGGVLIGWVSMIARRVFVTSVLPAPRDSRRSPAEFVLGVEGLPEDLEGLYAATAGALVCVGTWHSHLGTATPSPRDRRSAALVGNGEPRPMALLILGTDGLRAISAATTTINDGKAE
jgi:proteasome lid subunit RPN8/RPN11